MLQLYYTTTYALNVQTMDLFDYMEMDENEYIQCLKDLRHEGLIEIDLLGGNDVKLSCLTGTQLGLEYLITNETKSKIGFIK